MLRSLPNASLVCCWFASLRANHHPGLLTSHLFAKFIWSSGLELGCKFTLKKVTVNCTEPTLSTGWTANYLALTDSSMPYYSLHWFILIYLKFIKILPLFISLHQFLPDPMSAQNSSTTIVDLVWPKTFGVIMKLGVLW